MGASGRGDMERETETEIPLINFRSLRYLQEVERSGSFTDAADALRISQPALSQSLAELSKRLGASLFRKEGRRRVLTEGGCRTVRYADRVIGQTADLLRWLERWEKGEAGLLRVGMIDTACLYTVPAGLSRLREEHSEVELRLVVDDSAALLSMLDEYQLDLAFTVGPAGEGCGSAPIAAEPMYIYSPPHFPPLEAGGGAGEAAPEGWALFPPQSRTRRLVDQGLVGLGIQPRAALESANPTVLRQMAVLGYARTVLPKQVAESGGGAPVLEEGPLVAERSIEGVWRSDEDLDPRARKLIRLVQGAQEGETQLSVQPDGQL